MIILEITQDEMNNVTSKKNFVSDISIGEIGEKLFKQYLIDYKKLLFIRKSEEAKDLKKWDFEFLFKDNPVKYEVKTDVYIYPGKWVKINGNDKDVWVKGRDTGNLFVEFHSRGIESGISTTTAEVWVNIFFHLKEMWVIQTDILRNLINEYAFPVAEDSGDLNSKTKGYLIPREKFKKHFKIINYELKIN